ncbi:hypothetical protein BJF89_16035 [Corynebacterium sp. CNJ-954]|uniref:hypothetical protein n=1 Tax=Corynebacterium sp. CNJ-954 TaxID=1904962 RepID=UPI00095D9C0A|nr:hypothetical protein [Corynebacterium sp. CNJ-954]OLT55263.1 hypothetical protein BJF89_16035 [Corynebacterium sp. CNJ-954]
MNKAPTTKTSPRASSAIGAGVVLVLTMAVVIVSVGFVVVGWQGWMTATSYTTAVAPAALTTTGAMIVALVLYHRWNRDHYQREDLETARLGHAQRLETSRQEHADKLERDRITHSEGEERQRSREEYFRHRAQERGKRRESMGQRMATAVEHLSRANGMTQAAGLLELGGLVDDWWAFGQEWINDIDERDHESVERINAEVQRRRQELIDLIFKQRVPSVDAEGTRC